MAFNVADSALDVSSSELSVACGIIVAADIVIDRVLLDAELEMANVLTKFRTFLRFQIIEVEVRVRGTVGWGLRLPRLVAGSSFAELLLWSGEPRIGRARL